MFLKLPFRYAAVYVLRTGKWSYANCH